MILFTDPLYEAAGADDLRVGRSLSLNEETRSRRTETISILSVHVTQDLASLMLQGTGYNLESLQRELDDGLSPSELDLGEIRATVEIGGTKVSRKLPAKNVAGFLPGRDPELSREIIVIGAHHDHLGSIPEQPGDTVFNGADDNASGVAGVLELAELFGSRAIPPRRSLLFLTFSAEEAGLLGSEAIFTKNLMDTDNVVFMVNLDMIGRNPESAVSVYGAGFGLKLRTIVKESAEPLGLDYQYKGLGDIPANSDYGPFLDRNIPFLSLFTGVHDDYHQLTDHAERIDYRRMAYLVKLVAAFVQHLDGLETIGRS
jgi:hypothetical protein